MRVETLREHLSLLALNLEIVMGEIRPTRSETLSECRSFVEEIMVKFCKPEEFRIGHEIDEPFLEARERKRRLEAGAEEL